MVLVRADDDADVVPPLVVTRGARDTQNRAVSSSISTPMPAMNASSPVAFQYSHVAQATSAEMWCSMRPERMGTCSPLGP